jgi:hypothetical protein
MRDGQRGWRVEIGPDGLGERKAVRFAFAW